MIIPSLLFTLAGMFLSIPGGWFDFAFTYWNDLYIDENLREETDQITHYNTG